MAQTVTLLDAADRQKFEDILNAEDVSTLGSEVFIITVQGDAVLRFKTFAVELTRAPALIEALSSAGLNYRGYEVTRDRLTDGAVTFDFILHNTDKVFANPAVNAAETLIIPATRVINDTHSKILNVVLSQYTDEEIKTWPAKGPAAKAYLASTATSAESAMIEAEATGAGVTGTALAGVISTKWDAYNGLCGMAAMVRAQAETAIKTAVAAALPDLMGYYDAGDQAAINSALAAFGADIDAALAALEIDADAVIVGFKSAAL